MTDTDSRVWIWWEGREPKLSFTKPLPRHNAVEYTHVTDKHSETAAPTSNGSVFSRLNGHRLEWLHKDMQERAEKHKHRQTILHPDHAANLFMALQELKERRSAVETQSAASNGMSITEELRFTADAYVRSYSDHKHTPALLRTAAATIERLSVAIRDYVAARDGGESQKRWRALQAIAKGLPIEAQSDASRLMERIITAAAHIEVGDSSQALRVLNGAIGLPDETQPVTPTPTPINELGANIKSQPAASNQEFKQGIAPLETKEFHARLSHNNPRGVYLVGGQVWSGWFMDISQATLLRDWLNSVLPDETTCPHPASKGVRAWKCEVCGELRENFFKDCRHGHAAKNQTCGPECLPLETTCAECARLDNALTEELENRDKNADYADQLTNMVGVLLDEDMGEHTSGNDPWKNAIEALRVAIAKKSSMETNEERVQWCLEAAKLEPDCDITAGVEEAPRHLTQDEHLALIRAADASVTVVDNGYADANPRLHVLIPENPHSPATTYGVPVQLSPEKASDV